MAPGNELLCIHLPENDMDDRFADLPLLGKGMLAAQCCSYAFCCGCDRPASSRCIIEQNLPNFSDA
jgi:hypothetical protein